MKKVLIFSKYFRPAFKAGGPIQSIENILKIFGNKYNFLIVTGDRDIDSSVYKNIKFNNILVKKNFKILYCTKEEQSLSNFKNIIKNFNPHTIFLNSFFDYKFSILIAFLNKIIFKKKIIIVPRGELLKEAIKIKRIKKLSYILFSNILNIYQNTIFFVSSNKENKNLKQTINCKNISTKFMPVFYPKETIVKIKNLNFNRSIFKILYVSRIVENKNLFYCLKILKKLNFKIYFTIIGPIENKSYWNYCKNLISELKSKVKIQYLGYKSNKEIFKIMKKSHCLLLPSKFESFGHVIFQSFINGLPVITSKNTPWKNLKNKQIGADLELSNIDSFVKEIIYLRNCKKNVYKKIRANALLFSKKTIIKNKQFERTSIF